MLSSHLGLVGIQNFDVLLPNFPKRHAPVDIYRVLNAGRIRTVQNAAVAIVFFQTFAPSLPLCEDVQQ